MSQRQVALILMIGLGIAWMYGGKVKSERVKWEHTGKEKCEGLSDIDFRLCVEEVWQNRQSLKNK